MGLIRPSLILYRVGIDRAPNGMTADFVNKQYATREEGSWLDGLLLPIDSSLE